MSTSPTHSTTPVADAARDIFRRARKYIERGWEKYAVARLSDGRICGPMADDASVWSLSGAVDRALYETKDKGVLPKRVYLYDALSRVIHAREGGRALIIWDWHMAPERTKADVLAVLDGAIESPT